MKIKLLRIFWILLFLVFINSLWVSHPYFLSKINRFSSLGFFSVVDEKSENIKKIGKADVHLLKGEKITGEVKAYENNFGIVLVRFLQLSAKVSDIVTFRIREKSKGKWDYENNYKADQFQPNEYFTFGFPPIASSKDKIYIFEVESLAGTYKNGIGLGPKKPQAALVYKYTREDLRNFNTLSSFIFKKLVYAVTNANFLENWQVLIVIIPFFLFARFMDEVKIVVKDIIRFLPNIKKTNIRISNIRILRIITGKLEFTYLFLWNKIINFSKKTVKWFSSTKFYLVFLNTNTKKRIVIALLIFSIGFIFRFSATLVDQLGVSLFYAGLGGSGDYDQFIRASTCSVTTFCSAILRQNFVVESIILGTFFKVFGFTGALKVYLYFMLVLSSIVATLPYLLLSRKNWISIGGIIGAFFLATSDFLTNVSLNFPPDNLSLFTFSLFYIVYLLTLQRGTVSWLLLLGLMGFIDGMTKALLLISDPVALSLFSPVFLFGKVREKGKFLFKRINTRILLMSFMPILIFLIFYLAWEYFVYVKFSMPYFLRGLVETRGENFVSYTSFNDLSIGKNILFQLFYIYASVVVMVKRLIEYVNFPAVFLPFIFLVLFFHTFAKQKFPTVKFFWTLILSLALIILLKLLKNNFLGIYAIGDNIYIWTDGAYINIFSFFGILFLFVLNFGFSVLKLTLPILPYVIMLVILTKNSPFPRLHTHVVAWCIILFSYIFEVLMININKHSSTRRVLTGILILILFIITIIFPKMTTAITRLNTGLSETQNEVKYLKWVNENLPNNAIILAGGKSDLVELGRNIKKPIIYNALYAGAVLVEPDKIPEATSSNFTIVEELQSRKNFRKNKYLILEDDIFVWRLRVLGVADGLFAADPNTTSALHGKNYSVKVYKYNPALKKAIYELNLR